MSDRQVAFREKVEADRRKRATLYFNYPGPWEFLFSEAGRAISKTYPSAIVVYLHVIARQPLPPKKRERMRLEKLGLWPKKKPKEFSFPIEEGPIHGLGKKTTASGLRILHEVGAIDRLHPGSATRGDFATYVLSDRWRQWRPPSGGTDFMALEWKKAPVIGVRDDVTKQFVSTRIGKRKAAETFVLALKDTRKPSLVALKDTREKSLVVQKAMNKAPDAELLVAPKAIFLSEPSSDVDPGEEGKVKKKVRTLDSRSKASAAAIRRDDADTSHRIAIDPKTTTALAAALSSIVGHLPNEGMAKRKPGQPHRNLDPNMAPRLDHDYDPDLGSWAEDEAMTVSIGRGGTVQ